MLQQYNLLILYKLLIAFSTALRLFPIIDTFVKPLYIKMLFRHPIQIHFLE
ncbi:hypothetical protein HMPREF9374_3829 [Desmospora sp. 8437]|nr:hypothetical protein HMPREF9374_3829 [Desmospora sp. 8437]